MAKQTASDLVTRRKRVNEVLKKEWAETEKVKRSYLKKVKYTNMTAFRDHMMPRFIELVRRLCEANEFQGINRLTIEQEAAGELEISLLTARHWLDERSYSKGQFLTFGKNVLLNQNYRPPDEQEDEESEGSEE